MIMRAAVAGVILSLGWALPVSSRAGVVSPLQAADPIVVPLARPAAPDRLISLPDGDVLTLSSDRRSLLKIEPWTGAMSLERSLPFAADGAISTLDGVRIVLWASASSEVLVIEGATLSALGTLRTSEGPVDAAFSADGARLFVACGAARRLEAYSSATLGFEAGANLKSSPTRLAVLGSSGRVAVTLPDDAELVVFEGPSLDASRSVSVPAGSAFVAYGADAHHGLVALASPLAGLVTLLDAESFHTLRSLSLEGPGEMKALDAGGSWLWIARNGGIEVVDRDPLGVSFGRPRAAVFGAFGTGVASAGPSSDLLALSPDGSRLSRVVGQALADAPQIEGVDPSSELPGGALLLSSSASADGGALFLNGLGLRFTTPTVRRSPAVLEVEVPWDLEPGTADLRLSMSSPSSLATGTFVAGGRVEIRVLDSQEGLDRLIDEIDAAAGKAASTAEADALRRAAASLRNARTRLRTEGDYRTAFDAFRTAALDIADPALRRRVGLVAHAATVEKLRALEKSLGETHPLVVEARRAVLEARALLRSGDTLGSIERSAAAFATLETALTLARRLTPAQVKRIVSEVVGSMFRLWHDIRTAKADLHDPHTAAHSHEESDGDRSLLENAADLLLGHGSGHPHGTAFDAVCRCQMDAALGSLRRVVAMLEIVHDVPTGASQKSVADLASVLVGRVADAVEENAGAHDAAALWLRGTRAKADGAGTPGGRLEGLREAGPILTQLMASAMGEMTGPPCAPKVTIGELEAVCAFPPAPGSGGKGGIHPNPMQIPVTLEGLRPGEEGVLLMYIMAYDGQSIFYQFEVKRLPNGQYIIPWDGFGDDGTLVSPRGEAKQGTFYVKAILACPDDTGVSDPALEEFQVVEPGGLLVKPAVARKCASKPGHKVTEQFRAYRCLEAGEQEVTNRCHWSLGKGDIGKIGPTNGLFEAFENVKGSDTVTAVLPETGESGEAQVHVSPEEGGIIPSSVVLCVDDVVDFDVSKGCDQDGNVIPANDLDYTWTVEPVAAGVITANGVFRADQEGNITIRATPKDGVEGGPYTATAQVAKVDGMDVIRAPNVLCAKGGGQTFQVQVYCHNKPVLNEPVNFSSSTEVSVNPPMVPTGAGGLAQTTVTPKGIPSGAIGSTKVTAAAGGFTKTRGVTVGLLTMNLEFTPDDEEEPPVAANRLGGLIFVNNDDDNDDGVRDLFRDGIENAGDLSNLERLDVSIAPLGLIAQVRLLSGAGEARIYDVTTAIGNHAELPGLRPLADLGGAGRMIDRFTVLGIEGIAPSSVKSSVQIQGILLNAVACQETVALTVAEIDVLHQNPLSPARDRLDPSINPANITDYVPLVRPTAEIGSWRDVPNAAASGGALDMGFFIQIKDATRKAADGTARVNVVSLSRNPGGPLVDFTGFGGAHPQRISAPFTYRTDASWAVSDGALKFNRMIQAVPGGRIDIFYNDGGEEPVIRNPGRRIVKVSDVHMLADYGGAAPNFQPALVAPLVFETNRLRTTAQLPAEAPYLALRAAAFDPRPDVGAAVAVDLQTINLTPASDLLVRNPPNGGASTDFWVVTPNIPTPARGPVPAAGPRIEAGGHALDDGVASLQGQGTGRLHATTSRPAYFRMDAAGALVPSVNNLLCRFTVPIVSVNVDGVRSSAAGSSEPSGFTEPIAALPNLSFPTLALPNSTQLGLSDQRNLLVNVLPSDTDLAYQKQTGGLIDIRERRGGGRRLIVVANTAGSEVIRVRYAAETGQILSIFHVQVLPAPARALRVGFHFVAESAVGRGNVMHTRRLDNGLGNPPSIDLPVVRNRLESNINGVVRPILDRLNTIWRPYGIAFDSHTYGRHQGRIVLVRRDLADVINPGAPGAMDRAAILGEADPAVDLDVFLVGNILGATGFNVPGTQSIIMRDANIFNTLAHEAGHALGISPLPGPNLPGLPAFPNPTFHRQGVNDMVPGTNDDPDTDFDERRRIELMFNAAIRDSDLDGVPDEGGVEVDLEYGRQVNRGARTLVDRRP